MHSVMVTIYFNLKGSYDDAKRTLFCVFGVMQCIVFMQCKVKKINIIFHIPYIIVAPLCPNFLKSVDFYKAHRSEKHGVLCLTSCPVRCDWPNTSSA